ARAGRGDGPVRSRRERARRPAPGGRSPGGHAPERAGASVSVGDRPSPRDLTRATVSSSTLVAFLRTVTLFKEFADCDLSALSRQLRERRMKKGEVLFRE